jgi:hypothetical protein
LQREDGETIQIFEFELQPADELWFPTFLEIGATNK